MTQLAPSLVPFDPTCSVFSGILEQFLHHKNDFRNNQPASQRLRFLTQHAPLSPLNALDIGLSVDPSLDIAKTISTVTFALKDGTAVEQVMLTTLEQRMLAPLLPNDM